MFHLAAYTLAALGNTANTDIPALSDQVLLQANSHFIPAQDLQIIAATGLSATLNRLRLTQPTMRQITTPFVRPFERAVVPADLPGVADYRAAPLMAYKNEELAMEATSGVAMTERFTGLVWLQVRPEPIMLGPVYTLRGTSTTAATANAWSEIAVTWQDTPIAGNYDVVGLQVQSTNAIAARLIFEDQIWRPGALSITALGDQSNAMMLHGGLGKFGTFNAYRFPLVQVLANGADASHEIYMQIQRRS